MSHSCACQETLPRFSGGWVHRVAREVPAGQRVRLREARGSGLNAPTRPRVDDDTLMSLAQAGSREAFATLVERHALQVVQSCYRFSGEREQARELAQGIWVEEQAVQNGSYVGNDGRIKVVDFLVLGHQVPIVVGNATKLRQPRARIARSDATHEDPVGAHARGCQSSVCARETTTRARVTRSRIRARETRARLTSHCSQASASCSARRTAAARRRAPHVQRQRIRIPGCLGTQARRSKTRWQSALSAAERNNDIPARCHRRSESPILKVKNIEKSRDISHASHQISIGPRMAHTACNLPESRQCGIPWYSLL